MDTPKPITREDMYYNYLINGGDIQTLPKPITRREIYLNYLCQNGFGVGDGGDVTQEMLDAAVSDAIESSESYTNTKIAGLINGAPETLDTLKEVADAIEENETVVTALNSAIGNKLNKDGDASNTTATFTQASSRANIASGEKTSVIFGKIKKYFADLKTVAFSGSYNDLFDKPIIPTIPSVLPSHTYSYEEHIVGTWVDGRTLYEKTINFGKLPNNGEKSVPHNINNIRRIWFFDGYVRDDSTNISSFLQFPKVNNNITWQTVVDLTSIKIITETDCSAFGAMVTLRYVKTTD